MSEPEKKEPKAPKPPPVPPRNGAELTRLLARHGTGKDKLDVCRAVLQRVHDEDKGRRIATCDEVLAGLADALHRDHVTLKKAESLAKTGAWDGPDPGRLKTIDEILAPDPEDAAKADSVAEPGAVVADGKKETPPAARAGEKPAAKK